MRPTRAMVYRTPWKEEEESQPKGSLVPGALLFAVLAGIALGGACWAAPKKMTHLPMDANPAIAPVEWEEASESPSDVREVWDASAPPKRVRDPEQHGSPWPPYLLEGEKELPPEACIPAAVNGKFVVAKCTITAEGRVTHCRFIRTVPHLEGLLLSNLAARKYKPAEFQGKPLELTYTFPFRIPPCPAGMRE